MKTFLKKNIISLFAFSMFFPLVTIGAEINIESSKVNIRTNEEFSLSVMLNSSESINAVEGILVFPEDALAIKEIRDGNTVLSFWVEKPYLSSPGKISFSGITPGGFSGPRNVLFSVLFEARKIGPIRIGLDEVKALLSDGSGTESVISTREKALSVQIGDSSVRRETLDDKEPPEDFSLSISKDENSFDGKNFLVFASQDKLSGLNRFEVREGSWGWYHVATSPYVLRHQSLSKKIFVRAIDNKGNVRESIIEARYPLYWYENFTLLSILFVGSIAAFLASKKIWQNLTH